MLSKIYLQLEICFVSVGNMALFLEIIILFYKKKTFIVPNTLSKFLIIAYDLFLAK